MEFKGTKGEWLLNDTDDEIFGGKDNYHKITAGNGCFDYDGNIQSGFCITGYISKENAQLIASATEILEALQDLTNQVEFDCSIGSDPRLLELLYKWQKAKQAINKALGGQDENK